MKTQGITDERIFELIGAYGADTHAFPEAEREAARQRIAQAPSLFASALEEASLLDGALDGLADIPVSAALRETLIAGAPKPKPVSGTGRTGLLRFLPAWVPAGAVASLAMGVLIGVNVSAPVSVAVADDEADAVMYAALGFGEYALMSESTE